MYKFNYENIFTTTYFIFREFSYEAGNKCDPNQLDEDELEEELARKNAVAAKRPNSSGNPKQAQPQAQYRPQLAQY